MCGKWDKDSQSIPIISNEKMNGNDQVIGHSQTTYGPDQWESNYDESQNPFKFSKISRRMKIVLIFCTLANFISTSASSLMGPFYPLEARKKGMSLTMIGFVFSVYQLIVFLTSPIIGNFMTRIGLKFVYLSGVFVGGCCAILFGLLDKGPGGTIFDVSSILVRSVEAFGFAAFITAWMTIVSNEFPDYIGSVVALLKLGSALGFIISPVIGGFLYELGGYGLPFYTVGVAILFNGLAMFFCLPELKNSESKIVPNRSFFRLFLSPLVVFPMLTLYLNLAGLNLLFTTIADYLQQFDLSPAGVGAMFSISAVVFLIMAPISGYITDVKGKPSILIISGPFVGCIAWLLNGPSPLVPFLSPSLWSIGIGLVLVGVSYGCLQVPVMKCMVDGAYEVNYEKNADTCALVSGLFNSTYALGEFTGPLVGGALIERYGFPVSYTIVGLANFFMFLLLVGFYTYRNLTHRKKKDNRDAQCE